MAGPPDPVAVEPYDLPLAGPLATADGTLETRRGFLVRVDGGDVTGLGEAAPLPPFTESLAECERALTAAADVAARDGVAAAHGAIDGDTHPAAAHGLALASIDAAATRAREPLYRLLGGDEREALPVNATLGDGPPEATASEAAAAVDAGFGCVKVKVGARDPAADAARLRAVRDAVGPAVALRADANGAWTPAEAERALDALADVDLEYVEQPLAPADLSGHAALRTGSPPIALDEGVARHGIDAVLARGAADAVVVKPMAHGSPASARAVAVAARTAGLTVAVTTTVDAVVARTAAVHVAASLPSVAACGLATADRLSADLAPDPAPVADGRIEVPQRPGLGVTEGPA
jgi:o-succinylbenzoate synthase